MLNITSKRHIRFATLEQETAWVVVAVVLETRGSETVALTEPKVVKVIPKPQKAALRGGYGSPYTKLALSAPQVLSTSSISSLLSPYVPNFGYAQSNIIMWLAAQPPTV